MFMIEKSNNSERQKKKETCNHQLMFWSESFHLIYEHTHTHTHKPETHATYIYIFKIFIYLFGCTGS